jgi:hypothetical protein
MAGRCRPLRAGRLLPLVEGMVRLRRGFSSSPAASQCPCGTPARQEARGQAAIASILFNHLLARMAGGGSARLWPWTRPVGQRRHLLGRCGPGPKGPPACRCSGGSPHSTIQPHPCLLPAPASSASVCSCCGLPADLSSHYGCLSHDRFVMLSSKTDTARHSRNSLRPVVPRVTASLGAEIAPGRACRETS